jgi:hypothetical protein
MKRWTIRICLFLLLGAIVNVAVAWGWWIWPAEFTTEVIASDNAVAKWRDYAPPDWHQHADSWICCRHALLTYELAFRRSEVAASRPTDGITVYSEGWPLRSMQGRDFPETRSGFRIPLFNAQRRAFLSLNPIWPGFAINTLFYAAILWMMFAAPFALRRRSRINRGLCPGCAYSVGESDVCTECGKPIQRAQGCSKRAGTLSL